MIIVNKIKKFFAKKRLNSWQKDWSMPSKKRMQEIVNGTSRVYTPELEAFLEKACIRRYYDANKVCVDIYWHIKPSRKEGHVCTLHYRRDWDKVLHTLNKVEKHELPRAVYDAFKHIHK